MPELPEVETVRRGLAEVMEGITIVDVGIHRIDLRRQVPKGLRHAAQGSVVTEIRRRAKYLEFFLDNGHVILAHLGMSGRMLVDIKNSDIRPQSEHEHITFKMGNSTVIRFSDPRRFGLVDLCKADGLEDHPLLARLGVEPLTDAFDGRCVARLLMGKKTSIKSALLNQHVIAGLGNIYACEALWMARLLPSREAFTVSGIRAKSLAEAIKLVLNDAIAAGGSTLRDHLSPSGSLGYFQHSFKVYGRENEPCPSCNRQLVRIQQSGRSSFFCPSCQT